MGFQLATVFDILWNHPLVCGVGLLLLTPSLFHIVLYFSPLLISTTLFIIALISMGPRMEETKEEREKWAKGEKPIDSLVDENWPYTDWIQPNADSIVVKKRRTEDGHDQITWLDFIEEGKNKLAVWVDGLFKSGELKPLVSESASAAVSSASSSAAVEDKQATVIELPGKTVTAEVKSSVGKQTGVLEVPVNQVQKDAEEIKTVEVDDAPAATKPAEVLEERFSAFFETKVSEKELDMPELEIVELPQADDSATVIVASEALRNDKNSELDEPIWDTPVKVPEAVEVSEVSLNDPVQEFVLEKEETKAVLVMKKLEDEAPTAIKHSKVPEPDSVEPVGAASPSDVRNRILKDLQSQLDSLQSKRRMKYSQILSRRMSNKTNNKDNNINGTWH